MFHATTPAPIRVSDLIRDPILAAIFRQAEGDDPLLVEIEPAVPPRFDGAAAQVRELEFA